MSLFRRQRSSFSESMASCIEVCSKEDIVHLLTPERNVTTHDVEIEEQGVLDTRNGWYTHAVAVRGNAIGFINEIIG